MRSIPLIKANLKGFIRNWRNVVLLIIFPLILISIIFVSFNPNGMSKVRVGYSLVDEKTLDKSEIEEAVSSFATLTFYDRLYDCQRNLKQYYEFACIEISGTEPYILDVYYDNTREPIIWEIVERLKQAVDIVQKKHSKTIAEDFLDKFQQSMGKLDGYSTSLIRTDDELDDYITEINSKTSELDRARRDLRSSINDMNRDIAQARNEVTSARNSKNSYLSTTNYYLNILEDALERANQNDSYVQVAQNYHENVEDSVEDMDESVEIKLVSAEDKIDNYQLLSQKGVGYLSNIDDSSRDLSQTKSEIKTYQSSLMQTRDELQDIKTEFKVLEGLDAENLVNPVVLRNHPVYVPETDEPVNEWTVDDAAQGASFISLQTMFPTILILITLFLALLISSFISLSEINSAAYTRVKLIPRLLFAEFVATFTSSFIIVIIPVIIVMIIGDLLFRLGIFFHLLGLGPFLLLLISIFILVGMIITYLIRKESMALLACTFLLILLIFFSGFLLPIERMSMGAKIAAALNPSTLALRSFKQIVFYDQSIGSQLFAILTLVVQAVLIFLIGLGIKIYARDKE